MRSTRIYVAVGAATSLILVLFFRVLPHQPTKLAEQRIEPQATEKSKRMADYSHPDEYFAIHAAIRTEEDGERYPRNYRLDEFRRAVAARKQPGRKLDWVERGPANVPGRARALIIDPDDPFHQTWFVGSVGGGLWKTTDAGGSWQALTEHLPNLGVSALAMADSDRDVIYMGTGEGFSNVDAVDGSGIFRTTDRGVTWMQIASTAYDPAFRWVNRMAVDPANPNVLVLLPPTGAYSARRMEGHPGTRRTCIRTRVECRT